VKTYIQGEGGGGAVAKNTKKERNGNTGKTPHGEEEKPGPARKGLIRTMKRGSRKYTGAGRN